MAPVTSPFATINGSLPPLIPKPEDLLPPPPAAAMPEGSPGLQKVMQDTPRANVFGPTAKDTYEHRLDAKLGQDMTKDANPFGSADNHPGTWGKLLHGLSVLTGGPGRRAMEEEGLDTRLNALGKLNSEENLQGAQAGEQTAEAGKNTEETSEMPGKTASDEALQGAQTGEAAARTNAINNPPDTNPDIATYHSLVKLGMRPSEALREIEKDKAFALKPPGGEHVDLAGPGGKAMGGTYDPGTKKYYDAAGNEVANPQMFEKPNQAGMVTMIAPDPNTPGGGIIERLGAGAHVAPGSQTTAGVNSMNTPTTNQRTAAGRAETVLAMVPEVTARIDAMHGQIGPEMGRWNEFMQGKVGASNPQFAALRSDLLMMSSAVALAHAQGRLPENLREEFDNAINAPKQTPENLKATINAMVPWLQQVQGQGSRPGTESMAPQRPANVPEGYIHKDSGPHGAGWYKP